MQDKGMKRYKATFGLGFSFGFFEKDKKSAEKKVEEIKKMIKNNFSETYDSKAVIKSKVEELPF